MRMGSTKKVCEGFFFRSKQTARNSYLETLNFTHFSRKSRNFHENSHFTKLELIAVRHCVPKDRPVLVVCYHRQVREERVMSRQNSPLIFVLTPRCGNFKIFLSLSSVQRVKMTGIFCFSDFT